MKSPVCVSLAPPRRKGPRYEWYERKSTSEYEYYEYKKLTSERRLSKMRAEMDPHPLFRCLLDEQPTELVPSRRTPESASQMGRRLGLNPGCWFSRSGQLRVPFMEKFSREPEMIWVLDPATDALRPFWIGSDFSQCLNSLRSGDLLPPDLPPKVLSTLRSAQVLVAENHKIEQRRQWAEIAAKSKGPFQQRGYVELEQLFHPFHVAALRRYYRDLIAAGTLTLGDSQCAQRYGCHNEPVARFFHHQLTAAISALAGEPVQPSYLYMACYVNEAELEKHTDREQCEFSLSFCLDVQPEPADVSPWPLYLETPEGAVAIRQRIGDGVLYRGRHLPHYRERLPKGCTSTSIFFHFVGRDFAGPLD
jgi:hypothetical protein